MTGRPRQRPLTTNTAERTVRYIICRLYRDRRDARRNARSASGCGRAAGRRADRPWASTVLYLRRAANPWTSPVRPVHVCPWQSGCSSRCAPIGGTPLIVTRGDRAPPDGRRADRRSRPCRQAGPHTPVIALVVAAVSPVRPRSDCLRSHSAWPMPASSFVEFVGYVLRGLQRIHQETVMLFALRILTLAFGGWALWSRTRPGRSVCRLLACGEHGGRR